MYYIFRLFERGQTYMYMASSGCGYMGSKFLVASSGCGYMGGCSEQWPAVGVVTGGL